MHQLCRTVAAQEEGAGTTSRPTIFVSAAWTELTGYLQVGRSVVVSFLLFGALLVRPGAASAGEIHAAASAGDVEKVKALLDPNPELVNA
jgi:hypothetical protein